MPSWKGRKPCIDCGGEKPPGAGRRLCSDCEEKRLSNWQLIQRERSRQAWEKNKEKQKQDGKKGAHLEPDGHKYCPRCDEYKKFDHFGKNKGHRHGLNSYCKPCYAAYLMNGRLKKFYKMTPEEYWTMLEEQEGRCAICRKKPQKARLAVDHDHKCCPGTHSCGKCVRGLLCRNCNQKLLGQVQDDVEILRRAIDYLETRGVMDEPL